MLVVKNVKKSYGSFVALEDLNLEFKEGVYGLLAPNGAGKTTTIKMLTCLLKPTSGDALINGLDINTQKDKIKEIDEKAFITGLMKESAFNAAAEKAGNIINRIRLD